MAGRKFDKALRYAWRTAERALALLVYEEAARLYHNALEALELAGVADEKSRCELLLLIGEAHSRAGNTPAAKAAFIEAAAVARRLGRSRELARAAVGYGGRTPWVRAAGDTRLQPLLEEGLDAIGETDVELRARILARLAGALRDEPSRDRRDGLSREAVELARRSGSSAALAYALDGRSEVIFAPDTIAECLALGNELCEVAERIGDKERMVHGHMDRFVVQVLYRRYSWRKRRSRCDEPDRGRAPTTRPAVAGAHRTGHACTLARQALQGQGARCRRARARRATAP
jgi:tetratricopeptide (TPR) repeat protein